MTFHPDDEGSKVLQNTDIPRHNTVSQPEDLTLHKLEINGYMNVLCRHTDNTILSDTNHKPVKATRSIHYKCHFSSHYQKFD
jgi:hypothetical protein